MRAKHHLLFVLAIFVLAIVGGAFVYHNVEGWSLIDSFYFVVITVTTIGYGDLAPQTVDGKIFTMIFAFFGVATALYVLSTISSSLFQEHVGEKVDEIKKHVKVEKDIKEDIKDTVKKAVRGKKK